MDFADKTILHLLGTATRAALLDQIALEQLGEAAFDTSLHPLEGPFALDVARIDPGEDAAPVIAIDGHLVSAPGQVPSEIKLKAQGVPGASRARADLLFRGTLIARHTMTDDRIEAVSGGFAALNLDREIEADLGALPATPADLEAERRARLLKRLKEAAAEPALIDEEVLDSMLASAHADDVGTLLDRRGTAALARLALKFRSGGAPVVVPVQLPVSIAVLIRSAPLGLRDLLAESRAVQAALVDVPALQAPAVELRRRAAIPILCFVPKDTFDDNDWPGADRAGRRESSAELLGPQGIVLVPV